MGFLAWIVVGLIAGWLADESHDRRRVMVCSWTSSSVSLGGLLGGWVFGTLESVKTAG